MSSARRHAHLPHLTLSLAVHVSACADPLDAPSAYSHERYLCTAETQAEWQELVETCAEAHGRDGSCAGVASFAGELQGQPYVVESLLSGCSFDDVRDVNGDVVRDGTAMLGASPYFGYRLYFKGFGGIVTEGGASQQERTLGLVGKDRVSPLDNDQVSFELRLNTRGASLEVGASDGLVVVREQTTDVQDLTIVAVLEHGTLEGCFRGMQLSRSISTEHADD